MNGLVKKIPALLTSASIDWKRDRAVSTILAAVAGSPMWPSTRATWLEAATSVDWVIFRELATTLKPRSTKPCTIPAPIPCDAPVTMAVFRWPFMVVYLEKRLVTKFMVLQEIEDIRADFERASIPFFFPIAVDFPIGTSQSMPAIP